MSSLSFFTFSFLIPSHVDAPFSLSTAGSVCHFLSQSARLSSICLSIWLGKGPSVSLPPGFLCRHPLRGSQLGHGLWLGSGWTSHTSFLLLLDLCQNVPDLPLCQLEMEHKKHYSDCQNLQDETAKHLSSVKPLVKGK